MSDLVPGRERRLKFYISQVVIAEAQGRVALAEYYRNRIRKLTKDTAVVSSNKVLSHDSVH